MNEAIKALEELYVDVKRIYVENGKSDFDAGRLQGIGESIEALQRESNC